jgi:hypothetical protein
MSVGQRQAVEIEGSQTSPLDEKLEYANPYLEVKDISPKVTPMCFTFLPSAQDLDQIRFQAEPLHHVEKTNFKVRECNYTSRLRCDMRPR